MSRERSPHHNLIQPEGQKPAEPATLPENPHSCVIVVGIGPIEPGTQFKFESGVYKPDVDEDHPHRNFSITTEVMFTPVTSIKPTGESQTQKLYLDPEEITSE